MRWTPRRSWWERWPTLARSSALVGVLLGSQGAWAQRPADPVERLRQVLHTPGDDPAARDQATRACLEDLRSLGDLRRALCLLEWRDAKAEGPVATVDLANKTAIAERFRTTLEEVLQRRDSAAVCVAAEVLAETATSARATGAEPPAYVSALAPELARLIRQGHTRVRAPAARALGLINPEPTLALGAFADLFKSPDVGHRRGAAEGLANFVDAVGHRAEPNANHSAGPESTQVLAAAVGLAGAGLSDPSPDVRRRCVGILAAAGAALAHSIPTEVREATYATAARDLSFLAPLIGAFREQGSALARALNDTDGGNRLQAILALESVAEARARWIRVNPETAAEQDPFAAIFTTVMPRLATAVGDADIRLRRSALDVLELLGPVAAPVVPALVKALDDPDRFIRWSAVRTIGAVGPSATRTAALGLTRLLDDPDLDLRLAAANALKQLDLTASVSRKPTTGKLTSTTAGHDALPALLRSIQSGDTSIRVAAIATVRGLGSEAVHAVPALRVALADPDVRVRKAAAETLGAMGPSARDAYGDLRTALKDGNSDVRRAAGEALLNLGKAGQ